MSKERFHLNPEEGKNYQSRRELNPVALFQWPPAKQKSIDNFSNFGVTAFQEMFGSLDDSSPNNPFTRISVANTSFSLDPTAGCPETCHYCVRLSNARDSLVNDEGNIEVDKAFATPVTRLFEGNVLIENLAKHPAFLPNQSIISVSTGSSEAFAKVSSEETWNIFQELMRQGLKNPVWIVTKLGISPREIEVWRERFTRISEYDIPVVLSITSSGMPANIERNQRDRFLFAESLRETGIHISHHLRPIIRGMNDNPETIKAQLVRSLPLVESVCLGGLRADPGIVIAWEKVGGLDMDLLPGKPGEKDLPEEVISYVRQTMDELGYQQTPLFLKSSHAISHALGMEDFNLYQYRPKEFISQGHLLTFPKEVIASLAQSGVSVVDFANHATTRIGLPQYIFNLVPINETDVALVCNQPMTDYRVHRSILHSIGHLNIIPTNIYDLQRFQE